MVHLPFTDRVEAGRLLAKELSLYNVGDSMVLALARGGVPVGSVVADRLRLPLDVIVARKLGVPWQPELALGAIAGTARILDSKMIRELGISNDEIEETVAREQGEMRRREELYRGGEPALGLRGRTAILVDDGFATGSTMMAAVRHARSLKAARVVIGTRVGSRQACNRLRSEADDLVCLVTPELFFAVGQWYRDFRQVGGREVENLLAERHHRFPHLKIAFEA